MTVAEILLIGVALSMDAVAVGMTNGMAEPRMRLKKMLLVAGFYGVFQFLMPVLGYYGSAALTLLVEKIAPWLSFALLAFLGGKMIEGSVRETLHPEFGKNPFRAGKPLGIGKLSAQAVATSIDALAVGISLLAQEISIGLPFPAVICAVCIGVVTFVLSLAAVMLGKTAGNRLADKAELLGGVILVFIGIKLLLDGVL